MTKKQEIKFFEQKKVRSVWDTETEEWYFAVVDVVEVLTDSVNPTDYIKKMKKRDPELAKGWGQIVTPLSIVTPGGKQRVNCASPEGLFRIIQSIPSPKAEPFKQNPIPYCNFPVGSHGTTTQRMAKRMKASLLQRVIL